MGTHGAIIAPFCQHKSSIFAKDGLVRLSHNGPMDIARNLRKYRLEAGLSQTALSHKINAPSKAVNKIESGVQKCTTERAVKLAEALGISLADLVGDKEQQEILEIFRKLKQDDRQQWLAIGRRLSEST